MPKRNVYKKRYTSRKRRSYPYKKRYVKRTTYTVRKRKSYKKQGTNAPPMPVLLDTTRKALRAFCKANEENVWILSEALPYIQSATINFQTIVGDYTTSQENELAQVISATLGSPATGGYMQNLILKRVEHEITFSNLDTQLVEIRYWIVRAKTDIPAPGGTNAYHPSSVWQTGVENSNWAGQSSAPSSSMGYLNPASRPTDSALFSKFWYVVKERYFTLLPGGLKTIRYTVPNLPWKMLRGVEALTSGNSVSYPQGIGMGILFQMRGAPMYNNANASAVIGATQVLVSSNKRYHTCMQADVARNLNYNTNWVASVPVANQSYINPVTGVNPLFPLNVTTGTQVVTVQGTGSVLRATAVNVQTATT